jgi:hypothetical protein
MIEYHYHAAFALAAERRDSLLAQQRASRLVEQALCHRRQSHASATRRSRLRRAVTASWTAIAGAGVRAPRVDRAPTAVTEPLARPNCADGHAETAPLIVQPIE